jgi:prepilin-type N-terminal cleavage/methylation domain-containing protein
MTKPRPSFIQSLGFTMIELLIVISILGFLAVAVLAAINPIEQINRGKDTGSRSDAEQLLSSIDRYYASNGYYPWTIGPTDVQTGTSAAGNAAAGSGVQVLFNTTVNPLDETGCSWAAKLTSGDALVAGCNGANELKATFTTRVMHPTNYNTLQVYNRGNQGDSTYICFQPKSKQFLDDAKNRCVDAAGSGFPADIAIGAALCVDAVTTGTDVWSCLP